MKDVEKGTHSREKTKWNWIIKLVWLPFILIPLLVLYRNGCTSMHSAVSAVGFGIVSVFFENTTQFVLTVTKEASQLDSVYDSSCRRLMANSCPVPQRTRLAAVLLAAFGFIVVLYPPSLPDTFKFPGSIFSAIVLVRIIVTGANRCLEPMSQKREEFDVGHVLAAVYYSTRLKDVLTYLSETVDQYRYKEKLVTRKLQIVASLESSSENDPLKKLDDIHPPWREFCRVSPYSFNGKARRILVDYPPCLKAMSQLRIRDDVERKKQLASFYNNLERMLKQNDDIASSYTLHKEKSNLSAEIKRYTKLPPSQAEREKKVVRHSPVNARVSSEDRIDVLVSYAEEDEEAAERNVVRTLKGGGKKYTVKLFWKDVQPGIKCTTTYFCEMVRNASVVVILVSQSYKDTIECKVQFYHLLTQRCKYDLKIIPVLASTDVVIPFEVEALCCLSTSEEDYPESFRRSISEYLKEPG